MSCPYRVPLAGPYADHSHICGCPVGQHPDGHNCVDDRRRCAIARRQDKQFAAVERNWQLSQQLGRLPTREEIKLESVAEGLPPELAEIMRGASKCQSKA